MRVTARQVHLLEAFNLCERKSVIKRVKIVKTRVDEGSQEFDGCDGDHECGNGRC